MFRHSVFKEINEVEHFIRKGLSKATDLMKTPNALVKKDSKTASDKVRSQEKNSSDLKLRSPILF